MLGAVESYYKFPHNIVDAFGVDEEAREAGVFVIKKIVWDITFQVIFSYVLISMVCGIIVGMFLIPFVMSVCLSACPPVDLRCCRGIPAVAAVVMPRIEAMLCRE